jgi:DNA repair exonuclease SbcCD nuclease subunit
VFRFVHSSDLHLGKPFGRFENDLPALLREARYGALTRLAEVARAHEAKVILLAGDTFDAETPTPSTVRHALQAMADASELRWVILPGNHDSLAAIDLWRRVATARPENVLVALDATPIEIGEAVILPAPCTARRPGRDLTAVLDQETPEGRLRIGLAHGAVTEFSEEGNPALIPPDRATLSSLDYLALGDWHGQLSIGPRTWYSGTPEADSFKHESPVSALVVTFPGPGATPQFTPVPTGAFTWRAARPDFLPGEPVEQRLADLLPPPAARRKTLFRLAPKGRVTLAERTLLETGARAVQADFGWFEADLSGLAIHHDVADLDQIDRAGALRRAAEALWAETQNPALSEEDREVAAAALARLYTLASELA